MKLFMACLHPGETMISRQPLARSAFRRSVGDWDGVARDLDELEEIAETGPMRLYLCDMGVERTRLALAKRRRSRRLLGSSTNGPPKPESPGDKERKSLLEDATKHLAIAADYLEKCGYHRRDEELAELQGVLRRERTFCEPALASMKRLANDRSGSSPVVQRNRRPCPVFSKTTRYTPPRLEAEIRGRL